MVEAVLGILAIAVVTGVTVYFILRKGIRTPPPFTPPPGPPPSGGGSGGDDRPRKKLT